jgi:hypothetical protein
VVQSGSAVMDCGDLKPLGSESGHCDAAAVQRVLPTTESSPPSTIASQDNTAGEDNIASSSARVPSDLVRELLEEHQRNLQDLSGDELKWYLRTQRLRRRCEDVNPETVRSYARALIWALPPPVVEALPEEALDREAPDDPAAAQQAAKAAAAVVEACVTPTVAASSGSMTATASCADPALAGEGD